MTTKFSINPLKSKYVDIVYKLRSPKTTDIKLVELTSNKRETFRVSYGDARTISYETPSVGFLEFEIVKARGVDIEIIK